MSQSARQSQSQPPYRHRPPPMSVSSVVQKASGYARNALTSIKNKYRNLGPKGKVFVWFFILLQVPVIATFIRIGPARIFQTLYNAASVLRDMRFGWLLIGFMMVVTSFPPMFGHSECITISGFAWGIKGFLIVAPSSIIGSALSFIVLRTLFKRRITAWTRRSKKWQAMEEVIRARGLPLVILIRWCPIPWAYSNMFFASIESVTLSQIVIATVLFLPKLLLAVFMGAQVGDLSDGEHRGKMTTTAKVLNVLSIILGDGFAISAGLFVWRTTSRKIRDMEGLTEQADRLTDNMLDDESAPLLLLDSASQDSLSIFEDEGSAENALDNLLDTLIGRIEPPNIVHRQDASGRDW